MDEKIVLSYKEIIGVYLILRDRQMYLDKTMQRLYNEIEKQIQSKLTIEEFEKIRDIYEQENI
jgi:hypothetical protein